jgi:hypothetical protein
MRAPRILSRRISAAMLVIASVTAFGNFPEIAHAQDLGQPVPTLLPPTPAPPPPPPVYVPEVPVFGEVQQPRNVKPLKKAPPSFGDRATRCLDDAAAKGLSPNERNAYVGRCAN